MKTVDEVLDEIECRIREQIDSTEFLSMEWRMGMACVMHVEAVRIEVAS